jgi:hypothetical protein
MRTTVRLDDQLLAEVKAYAAKNGRSLNSVMEDALMQMLQRVREGHERARIDLPIFDGRPGYQPGIDPDMDITRIADDLDTQDMAERAGDDAAL